jgi:hypothetical protein
MRRTIAEEWEDLGPHLKIKKDEAGAYTWTRHGVQHKLWREPSGDVTYNTTKDAVPIWTTTWPNLVSIAWSLEKSYDVLAFEPAPGIFLYIGVHPDKDLMIEGPFDPTSEAYAAIRHEVAH